MKRLLLLGAALAVWAGCDPEALYEGPDFYTDGFEDYRAFGELLPPGDGRWSFTQVTRPGNAVALDSAFARTGERSLRFEAVASDGQASKASIAKQNMAFWEGETVRFSASYRLEGTGDLEWLFLMDLEEQTAVGAGPGMRLALVDGALRVEYKFNEDDITQPAGAEVPFPRDAWVDLVWEVKLSRDDAGEVRLWQDGVRLIDRDGLRTLPRDFLYFQQGTKGQYSSAEIGITANSRDGAARLWVDDVTIERL